MSSKLLRALNLCSALFVTLAFFPPVVVYHAITCKSGAVSAIEPVWQILLQMVLCITLGFLGRAFGLLCDKASLSSMARRLLELPLLLLLGALLYFTFGFLGFFPAISVSVFGVLAFAVTGGMRFHTYGEILSRRSFFWYAMVYGAVLLLLEFFEAMFIGAELFAAFLFVALILMLFGANQSGIDFMMHRRQHKFEQLPQKIRNYNVRLFLIASSGLLVLFLLYQPIAQLLGTLFNWFKAALLWVLTTAPEVGGEDYNGTPMPGLSDDPFEGKEGKGGWEFLDDIFILLIVVGILYHRKAIFAKLKALWEKIADLFSSLFWGGRDAMKARKQNEENEYYTETEERIEESAEEKVQKTSTLWRKWRRDCRKFTTMPDSPEALREGYRLILRGIRLKGVPVEVSQTTLEICRTVEETGLPSLQSSTSGYNSLRYGEKEFELGSMAEIRNAVNELLHYKE